MPCRPDAPVSHAMCSCRSTIEECPDEDPETMKVKVSYVRLDGLGNYVGKKASTSKFGCTPVLPGLLSRPFCVDPAVCLE